MIRHWLQLFILHFTLSPRCSIATTKLSSRCSHIESHFVSLNHFLNLKTFSLSQSSLTYSFIRSPHYTSCHPTSVHTSHSSSLHPTSTAATLATVTMANVTFVPPEADPYSLESVVFRLNQGLNFENGDPLIADFALIHSPTQVISLLAVILVTIKLVQVWMSTRSTAVSFARPAFLVNCGLCFGINGCGFFIALAVTNNGSHLFKEIELPDLSLYTIFCRYLVFTYFATCIYDLASLIFVALQKQTLPNFIIARQLVWIASAYVIVKHQPIGFTILLPLVHCLLKVMNNMLTVMDTASSELKPEAKWSKRVQIVSILLHLALLCHLGYFASIRTSCPSWVITTLITLVTVQTVTLLTLAISTASSHDLKQNSKSSARFTNLILG